MENLFYPCYFMFYFIFRRLVFIPRNKRFIIRRNGSVLMINHQYFLIMLLEVLAVAVVVFLIMVQLMT